MHTLVLTTLLIAASPPASALRQPPVAAEAAQPTDLMSALRAADYAEIYDLRGIEFPMAARPDMVRQSGCQYVVSRPAIKGDSRWWRDLERSLKQADLRLASTAERPEVAIGLVLSDWRGTLWEIYLGDLPDEGGKVGGFEQRRPVKASASIVGALKDFIARHPELAGTDQGGADSPHCPPRPPLLMEPG